MRGPAAPPCPSRPWHSKQPYFTNSFAPFCESPFGVAAGGGVCAARMVVPRTTAAPTSVRIITSPRLRDDVEERGLAAFDDRDGSPDCGTEIVRVRNRPFGVPAHALCQ